MLFMSGVDGIQKMSSMKESTAALDRAVAKWKAEHIQEQKQKDVDKMLFEWRKKHGKCPYCGKELN